MRNTVAVLAVAFYGFSWVIASLPGFWIAGASATAIWSMAVLLAGVALIVFRRPIAAWIVRGAESDSGVLALAAIRGIGLLLLFNTTKTIVILVQQFAIPSVHESAVPTNQWLPAVGAMALAQLAAAIVLLTRSDAVANVLDSAPDDSPRAVQMQTIVFGAIALWVLIDDIPNALSSGVRIWKHTQSGDTEMVAGSMLWAFDFPEMLATLVRIVIALWIFFGRVSLARAWHRLRPMAASDV